MPSCPLCHLKWSLSLGLLSTALAPAADCLSLEGVTVTPHLQSVEMRYRREPDRSLGARVQIYLRNASEQTIVLPPDTAIRLRNQTPAALLAADEWSWHDLPEAWTNQPLTLPPGALTVWSWNGKREKWGAGTETDLAIKPPPNSPWGAITLHIPIARPDAWISAITFLGSETNPCPDTVLLHLANQGREPLRIEACRLWLPLTNATWRALLPTAWRTDLELSPPEGAIPPGDRACVRIRTGPLPLTYAALEVRLRRGKDQIVTLWGHVRVKREWFDISGGWVNSDLRGRSSLTTEPYLKTLRRMHINTAHIAQVPGYTDHPDLYSQYPLKYFNRLEPVAEFDTPEVLPRVHAVEFMGEPQYGGGRPVPPMEVWRALARYQGTRLSTTVTHSEERVWRFYAGLSDFPHYDAYRVTAPSADAWSLYGRWGGEHLRWGAPLETIGEMTRSLRELNRPGPVACWSQGASTGWERYGGRQRTAPTPDELRMQAYQALAARITSLYWFNLSLAALVEFPDLIDPIARVGREIRMLDRYYLEGDAFNHTRLSRDGKPDWDLSVIAGPNGALCFAMDLAYEPDPREKVFKFGPPRTASLSFPLPAYLSEPSEVLRVDADSITPIPFDQLGNRIRINERCGAVNVFVVAARPGVARELAQRREALLRYENSFGFDPASRSEDLAQLRQALHR